MKKRLLSLVLSVMLLAAVFTGTFAVSASAQTENLPGGEYDRIISGNYPSGELINIYYKTYTNERNLVMQFTVEYNDDAVFNAYIFNYGYSEFYSNLKNDLKTALSEDGFAEKKYLTYTDGSHAFIAESYIPLDVYEEMVSGEESVDNQTVTENFFTYKVSLSDTVNFSSIKNTSLYYFIKSNLATDSNSIRFYYGVTFNGTIRETNADFAVYSHGEDADFYYWQLDNYTFSSDIYAMKKVFNPKGVIISIIGISLLVCGIVAVVYFAVKNKPEPEKREKESFANQPPAGDWNAPYGGYYTPPQNPYGQPAPPPYGNPFGEEYNNPNNPPYYNGGAQGGGYGGGYNGGWNGTPYNPYNPYGGAPYNSDMHDGAYNPYNVNNGAGARQGGNNNTVPPVDSNAGNAHSAGGSGTSAASSEDNKEGGANNSDSGSVQ